MHWQYYWLANLLRGLSLLGKRELPIHKTNDRPIVVIHGGELNAPDDKSTSIWQQDETASWTGVPRRN